MRLESRVLEARMTCRVEGCRNNSAKPSPYCRLHITSAKAVLSYYYPGFVKRGTAASGTSNKISTGNIK